MARRIHSLEDLIACASRELAMREQVYPRQVERRSMKPDDAARELALMRSLVQFLQSEAKRALAVSEPVLFEELGQAADSDGWQSSDSIVKITRKGQPPVWRVVEEFVMRSIEKAPEWTPLDPE